MSIVLKHLPIAVMQTVTAAMLDPKRELPILESQEDLAAHVRILYRAHEEVSTVNVREGSNDQEVAKLTALLTSGDSDHDGLTRGIHGSITSAAELIRRRSPRRADRLLEVRDILFPEGMAINNRSYMEQSGNTARVATRVTPEIRRTLDTIVVDGRPLSEYLDAWFEVGREMGELVTRRATLVGNRDDAVGAAELHAARLRWMRAVSALISMLDFVEISPEDRT